jgi:hypothetical protein
MKPQFLLPVVVGAVTAVAKLDVVVPNSQHCQELELDPRIANCVHEYVFTTIFSSSPF